MNTAEKIALGAGGASVVVLITLWLTLGRSSSTRQTPASAITDGSEWSFGDGYDGDYYNSGGKRRRRKTRRRK
jgi:hypothetical protein